MSAKEIQTLWYTRCPVPTPLGIASQLGWINQEFASDGIEIKTLQEVSDPALRESHYDHHLPNSFRQGGNVPALWARAQGADTRVIGLNWVDESQLIITLPESGIRTPRALKGRRLALPLHGNTIDHGRAGALRGFVTALQLGGLSADEAEFVDVAVDLPPSGWTANGKPRPGGSYATLVTALLEGRVDAIYVKGARGVETAALLGAHVVTDLKNHPDPVVRANNGAPRPITVDAGLLRDRPDLVVRFLSRVVQAGDWAARHPNETVAYVAQETGSSEAWVRQAYGDDLHRRQNTDLAESSIYALESYKNFLVQWGFLKQDFNVRAWIDPVPLAQVFKSGERRVA